MDVTSAASLSALASANFQAQASLLILRKTLELQQATALQLLQTAAPGAAASSTIGTRIDTYA